MDAQTVVIEQAQARSLVAKGLGKFRASVTSAASGMFTRKRAAAPQPIGAVEMMDLNQTPTHRKSDSTVSSGTETSSIADSELGPL